MFSHTPRRLLALFFIAVATVGCDQATKHLARTHLAMSPPLPLLGGSVELVLSLNSGAFLSLGASLPQATRAFLFTGLAAAFVVAAVFILLRRGHRLGQSTQVGLALAAAGGLGNLIDRLSWQGFVTDFLVIRLGPLHTGIFNVADMAITVGALILVAASRTTKGTPA